MAAARSQGGRHEHPGRQVVRRAVDGGAAAARADALGGKRDAAGRAPANGTTARASIPSRAGRQHEVFADLVAASGAELEWLPDVDDGLSDSVFTHDPSLMTDHGAIILAMGKALRRTEPALHEAAYRAARHPDRSAASRTPGQVEGGDCVWVDDEHAGDRPRRAHQPVRHRADGRAFWRRSASRCSATTCRCGWARKPACI